MLDVRLGVSATRPGVVEPASAIGVAHSFGAVRQPRRASRRLEVDAGVPFGAADGRRMRRTEQGAALQARSRALELDTVGGVADPRLLPDGLFVETGRLG